MAKENKEISNQKNPPITVDGVEYDFEGLNDDAKTQVVHMRMLDSELFRLNAQIAIFKTAQNAYINAFKEVVKK